MLWPPPASRLTRPQGPRRYAAANQRYNIKVNIRGKMIPLKDAAAVPGILYGTVVDRIRGGWTIDRVLGLTSGPVGQFDALTGRMLGNFPKAYSHVGFILRAQLEPAKRSGSGTRAVSFAL